MVFFFFFYKTTAQLWLTVTTLFSLMIWLHGAFMELCEPQSFINTLRPKQNGRRFANNVFKCIFLNENVWISLKISLQFFPKVLINNIPVLVQILAWLRSGDKPLSELMMVSLLTHICVTRPQCVNSIVIHEIYMCPSTRFGTLGWLKIYYISTTCT